MWSLKHLSIIVVVALPLFMLTALFGYNGYSSKAVCHRGERFVGGIQMSVEWRQTNHSVIAAAVPNFGNQTLYIDGSGRPVDHEPSWGYLFNLPITALAWKRMGFKTIVILTVDSANMHDSARRLLEYVDKVLRRLDASVVYFDMPARMKIRLSQILRLVGGQLDMVKDNDFVITGDADLWPLDRRRYILEAGKQIHVTNAMCCGLFQYNRKPYRMFPLSNIAMTGRLWRRIFKDHLTGSHKENRYGLSNIRPLIRKIEEFANSSDIYNHYHGGKNWYLDQLYGSFKIGNYLDDYGRIIFQFERRMNCTRIHTDHRWRQLMANIDTYECLSDAHMFKSHPWDSRTWKQMKRLTIKVFDKSEQSFLENYRTLFDAAYRNKSFQIP